MVPHLRMAKGSRHRFSPLSQAAKALAAGLVDHHGGQIEATTMETTAIPAHRNHLTTSVGEDHSGESAELLGPSDLLGEQAVAARDQGHRSLVAPERGSAVTKE